MKARVLFGVFGFAFVLLALYVFPPIVLELVVAALCSTVQMRPQSVCF